MIRALLVDYNPEIINYYKGYLKSYPLVRIAATLSESSADKFFDVIKNKNINFIIMDIRFFALASLRIISQVQDEYPHVKMLILGTYEDHDYLRAAMERGAADYLYRPLKSREFELCMGRIIKIFEAAELKKQEAAQILKEYDQSISLFRDRFLTNLVGGVLVDEVEVNESMDYFGLEIDSPYTVFVLRIDHFRQVIAEMNEKQKHLQVYSVYYVVRKFLEERKLGLIFINSFNSISCILGGLASLDELIDICKEIKDEVAQKTELSVTIGLGRPYNSILDLSISAKEAESALRYRYLLGYDTTIPIDFVESDNHVTYRYPAKKESLLVYTAVAGEYEYAKRLLGQILGSLEASRLPERILPKIIMNIVISISRLASEQHMDTEARFREFFNFGHILSINTIDEARTYLEAALMSFCGYISGQREESADKAVTDITAYIDNKYYEDISLESLAQSRRTTPEYLDKIFRARMKTSIKDYLTTLRMQKAKEILVHEEVEDDVVAVRVGYRDVRVFRSIFRRREGMMPQEFMRLRR